LNFIFIFSIRYVYAVIHLQSHYNIAIIGGGILGNSVAYFLSSIYGSKILLIEQERNVAFHTSSRNTGKVHAPILYDPLKKKLFAKAAFLGYDMWYKYSNRKQVLFKQDGVLEVAVDQSGIDRLQKYMEWGEANGLRPKEEIKLLEKNDVKKLEPSVHCNAGLYCSRDASADYGCLTRGLFQDSESFGCRFLLGHRVRALMQSGNEGLIMIVDDGEKEKRITTEFLINAAGGNALDIAHSMNLAEEFTDLHFRGEYWQAPAKYRDLTKRSIYSVPKIPDYPFLDPHWIVRTDGRREIGPNAVPVFGPYAYNWRKNLKYFLPKIIESLMATGARKMLFDKQFLSLISNELKSSLSKSAMINRAKKFLPQLAASAFSRKGTAGIRSLLVNKDGRFVPDTLIIKQRYSIHVLNYNSPGATGALPMAALIVNQLFEDGILSSTGDQVEGKSMWDFREIAHKMNT
jgi:L-2-hydroxyglutarate oxidase